MSGLGAYRAVGEHESCSPLFAHQSCYVWELVYFLFITYDPSKPLPGPLNEILDRVKRRLFYYYFSEVACTRVLLAALQDGAFYLE